ncbi:hypothetical protein HMPREF1860_01318, partial [Prevotella amnii]
HQFCVAHLKRQVINSVAHKDKPAIASELSEVFRMEDDSMDSLWGYEHFVTFVDRWEKKYPTSRNTRQKEIRHISHIWTFQKKCKGVYTRLTG